MKKTTHRLFGMLLLMFVFGCARQMNVSNPAKKTKKARVVGYFAFDQFHQSNKIDYCKLTHLNLAFANPDANGNLHIGGDIESVIKEAKSKNPKIIISISIAGAVMSDQIIKNWSNLIDVKANRHPFVKKIVKFVLDHKLDGVDVDLEWDRVTLGYSGFVIELKKELKKINKILTAALPNNYRFNNINTEALNSFDFINIMSYDRRGPWTPNDIGQHSSLNNSKRGIKFWKITQGISGDKLTLGVPFYGYNFTYKKITSVFYKQMVEVNPAFADKDQLGKIYYNGRQTIAKKVELAAKELSGIMIWELSQDSFGKYSLLDVIHKKYTSLGIKTTNLCGN